MTLYVQLNQDFRSFEQGFTFQLTGDLVVLSGVNGSGKSQLLDIIRRTDSKQPKIQLSADVRINDTAIDREMVAYRSFKENISLPAFKEANPDTVKNSKHQVWNAYNSYLLNTDHQSMLNNQSACAEARAILIGAFGQEKFDKKKITQTQIMDCLELNEFIWKTDDIFENVISEIFYNYATDKLHAEAEAGRQGDKFDDTNFPTPPWKELNTILERFGFDYRFKDRYWVYPGGYSLNEKPALYAVDEKGMIATTEMRELNDLSDGEKSIISLVFGSLAGAEADPRKVLLFDEFDASLNPSLSQIFYQILDTYFIKRGMLVIIATHSPTTIALAPDSATFYEVFKRRTSSRRILPVLRDSYGELRIANQHYVQNISDQRARIEELEANNTQLNAILENEGHPIIYVEGPTDVKYIKRAYELCGHEDDLNSIVIDIIGEVTTTGTRHSNDAALNNAWKFLQSNMSLVRRTMVLLHDPESKVEEENRNGILYRMRMPKYEANPLNAGIENLFANDLIERLTNEKPEYFQHRIVGTKKVDLKIQENCKSNVCNWILENTTQQDFAGFLPLITKINAVVTPSS